jgi:succinate dehydrogenase / fumarate reductase cytochrome b subunit
MTSRFQALSSSIGTKLVIGLTGLGLFGYLIVHVLGNVLVFFGPGIFNSYSAALLRNPLIPVIEVGLLVIFVIHIYKTIRMYLKDREARPAGYVVKRRAGPPSRKTFASSTMIVTGLWLLIFVVIHVKTFKYGAEYEAPGAPGVRDLYRLEMENFASPLVVGFYVLTMMIVGSHLWHGVSSAFQSLGADGPGYTPKVLVFGKLVAVGIAGGFIVIALWAHLVGGRS